MPEFSEKWTFDLFINHLIEAKFVRKDEKGFVSSFQYELDPIFDTIFVVCLAAFFAVCRMRVGFSFCNSMLAVGWSANGFRRTGYH